MRKSVAQEKPNGCGIACFAFVCGIRYQDAEEFLGPEQANSSRFIVKHFRGELNRYGLQYESRHVRPGAIIEPKDGMIVLLRRSPQFPVGHYFAYHEGKWMDPRINLVDDREFQKPISGFRDELPGEIMYTITPA